jgi:hypothetical protein
VRVPQQWCLGVLVGFPFPGLPCYSACIATVTSERSAKLSRCAQLAVTLAIVVCLPRVPLLAEL